MMQNKKDEDTDTESLFKPHELETACLKDRAWFLSQREFKIMDSIIALPVSHQTDRNSAPENHRIRDLMNYEVLRLSSFRQCHFSEELNQNQWVTQLAADGFYCDGTGCAVSCYSCGIHYDPVQEAGLERRHDQNCLRHQHNIPLSRWTDGLTPHDLRVYLYSYGSLTHPASDFPPDLTNYAESENSESPFLFQSNGRTHEHETVAEGNLPVDNGYSSAHSVEASQAADQGAVGQDGPVPNLSGASYPHFASKTARLATFQFWNPEHSHKAEDLADIGFFYAGYADCVRCFYCGLGLKFWLPTDIPSYEHARFRPHCIYNKLLKDQTYVDQALQQVNGSTSQTRPVTDHMASEAAQRALNSGWRRGAVERVVGHLVETLGEDHLSFDILHDILRNQSQDQLDTQPGNSAAEKSEEDEAGGEHQSGEAEPSHKLTSSLENGPGTQEVSAPSANDEPSQIQREILRVLETENEILQKRHKCTKCHIRRLASLYLPCGHVVSCQECAEEDSVCCVCHQQIEDRVKIYLS